MVRAGDQLMRIGLVAPLWNDIVHPFQGGIESYVGNLCIQMFERGHSITLYASAGSFLPSASTVSFGFDRTQERIVEALRADNSVALLAAKRSERDFAAAVLTDSEARRLDVLHNCTPYALLVTTEPRRTVPIVTSPHFFPVDSMFESALRKSENPTLMFVSAAQAEAYSRACGVHGTIVSCSYPREVEQFGDAALANGRLLFAGRICAEKGVADALEVAINLGLPIDLAGAVQPADIEYFDTVVDPILHARGFRYLGHLTQCELLTKMRHYSAALLPSKVPEAGGQMFIEAQALGVPVVGYRVGCVNEVICSCLEAADPFSLADLTRKTRKAVSFSVAQRQELLLWARRRFDWSDRLTRIEGLYRDVR